MTPYWDFCVLLLFLGKTESEFETPAQIICGKKNHIIVSSVQHSMFLCDGTNGYFRELINNSN